MRLVTGDFRPQLTLRTYEERQLDPSAGTDFSSLDGIYEAVDSYCQDASAFAWLTRNHRGDATFWAEYRPRLQLSVLTERSRVIGDNISLYLSSFDLEHLERQDHIFLRSSILRHKGATLILKMLPLPEKPDNAPDTDEISQFEDFIQAAVTLRDIIVGLSTEPQLGDNSNVDLAVVPSLYVTGSSCRDERLRKQILGLAMDWPQREHLWDGPALRHMLDVNGIRSNGAGDAMTVTDPGSGLLKLPDSLPGLLF
jgi:hypothetical protein